MIGLADCAEGGPGQHAENCVGIFGGILLRADVEGPNAGIIRSVEAEMPGDFAQIVVLGGADEAIGEGDVKKAAEKVLEDRPIIGKQPADLSSVALEPGGALPGKVEDEPDMLLFARRHLKHLAKGGDFVAGHGAVGLGHLGAERNHRDRERDAAARVAIRVLAVAVRRQPARGSDALRPPADCRAGRQTTSLGRRQ